MGNINSIEVRIAAPPTLAKIFNVEQEGNWFDQKAIFEEGASVSDLLERLKFEFPEFRLELLERQRDNSVSRMDIFLNGSLFLFPNAKRVKLNDRDIVIFLPGYFGRY